METEITIFEIPSVETTVAKSQKELEYEEIQKNSKLNIQHFKNFYEIELHDEKMQRPKTNITSVLCKYIAQFCIPILAVGEEYHIALQNENPIYVYDSVKKIYKIIPANDQFKVVGLQIPTLFVRAYSKSMLANFDHISTKDLAISGHYGHIDWQTYKYTLQREGLTHPGLPRSKGPTTDVLFVSNEDAMAKLRHLSDYIEFLEAFYNGNIPELYNNFKLHQYTSQFINNGKKDWLIKRSQDDSLLEVLSEAVAGEFGQSFDQDVNMTLEINKLSYAYNVGKFIGVDNDLFQQAYHDKKKAIDYLVEYNKQLNEGFSKKLEIAKKQTIAFNKYGISNLSELDGKQAKIVELEYTKFEKYISKNLSIRAKLLQKLFYQLRISFQDVASDRLSKALHDIHKELTKAELKSGELLEGGVCPHLVRYGDEMLKHFGKPWMNTELRDMLINEFSLPKDKSGYTCKICGEQIAEADNEDVMKFVAGERTSNMTQEDPIQTMIWKEAMYVITTYVKFNTPIPLKPLVNSIAQGLRGVIGEEETKLIKSKTSTTDSVRDTLNLYANIYIYAALCSMMIQNPNKMIFGRDKPTNIEKTEKIVKDKIRDKSRAPAKKIEKSAEIVEKALDEVPQTEQKLDHDYLDTLRSTSITGEAEDEPDEPDEPGDSPYVESPSTPVPAPAGRLAPKPLHRKVDRSLRSLHKVKGGKTTQDIKLYERYILTTALNLILLTKDAIIKRLKNINIDVVKQVFLKNAYTWARIHSKPIRIENDSAKYTQRIQTVITTDPFYQYLYYAKKLAHNSGADKHAPKSLDDIKGILGRDADKIDEELKQGVDLYVSVKMPPAWHFANDTKTNLYDQYSYASFTNMAEYIMDRLYTKERVPMHPQVAAHYENSKALKELERKYLESISKQLIRPMFQIEWLNDIRDKYNDFRPEKIDLAQHYCPTGERHKPTIFIYKYKNTEVELTKNDIVEWLKVDDKVNLEKFSEMRLINERCERCKNKVRDAQSNERSDKALANMFKKIDDVLAFYQYYDTRCPKGDLHNIIDSKCTKCGLHTEFKKKSNEEYYQKYSAAFKKIELEKQHLAINSLEQARQEIQQMAEATFVKKESPDYKLSLQKTAEWSQLSGIKYNVLLNIGLCETHKFDDIEKARINPAKLLEEDYKNNDVEIQAKARGMYKTQAIRLKGYILQILREYNIILNFQNVADIPLELKEIIEAQKKTDIAALSKSMPNFANDFIKKDTGFKDSLDNQSYANFLMEYLAALILTIHNNSAEKYKTMAKLLVKYFSNQIVMQEKNFSKAEAVFLKLADDITKGENDTEDEQAISADEYNGNKTDSGTDSGTDEENAVETYENVIDDNAMDVENPDEIWEND